MAELVDALVSKTNNLTVVPVRFRLRVQSSMTKTLDSIGFQGFFVNFFFGLDKSWNGMIFKRFILYIKICQYQIWK